MYIDSLRTSTGITCYSGRAVKTVHRSGVNTSLALNMQRIDVLAYGVGVDVLTCTPPPPVTIKRGRGRPN